MFVSVSVVRGKDVVAVIGGVVSVSGKRSSKECKVKKRHQIIENMHTVLVSYIRNMLDYGQLLICMASMLY